MRRVKVGEVACSVCVHGVGGPIFIWGVMEGVTAKVEEMDQLLQGLVGERPYVLVAFEKKDWNASFSPWEAPPVFGGERFEGQGRKTLDFICKELMPALEKSYRKRNTYLVGHSLAGLFALWGFYEKSEFAGAIACSASLWFPKWQEYMLTASAVKDSVVYLSLGMKEKHTKNQVMATVEDATRLQERIMKEDENIRKCVLEWNVGGHFSNTELRVAKGIAWVLEG